MKKLLPLVATGAAYLLSVGTVFAQDPLKAPGGSVNLNPDQLTNIPQLVVNGLFGIATFLAIGYMMFGGIKWITSRGDKQGVESARKHLTAAIIGLIVVAGTFFFINVLFSIIAPGQSNPLKDGFKPPTLENPNSN